MKWIQHYAKPGLSDQGQCDRCDDRTTGSGIRSHSALRSNPFDCRSCGDQRGRMERIQPQAVLGRQTQPLLRISAAERHTGRSRLAVPRGSGRLRVCGFARGSRQRTGLATGLQTRAAAAARNSRGCARRHEARHCRCGSAARERASRGLHHFVRQAAHCPGTSYLRVGRFRLPQSADFPRCHPASRVEAGRLVGRSRAEGSEGRFAHDRCGSAVQAAFHGGTRRSPKTQAPREAPLPGLQ